MFFWSLLPLDSLSLVGQGHCLTLIWTSDSSEQNEQFLPYWFWFVKFCPRSGCKCNDCCRIHTHKCLPLFENLHTEYRSLVLKSKQNNGQVHSSLAPQTQWEIRSPCSSVVHMVFGMTVPWSLHTCRLGIILFVFPYLSSFSVTCGECHTSCSLHLCQVPLLFFCRWSLRAYFTAQSLSATCQMEGIANIYADYCISITIVLVALQSLWKRHFKWVYPQA